MSPHGIMTASWHRGRAFAPRHRSLASAFQPERVCNTRKTNLHTNSHTSAMTLSFPWWIRACGLIKGTMMHQNHHLAPIHQDLLRLAGRLGELEAAGECGTHGVGGWRRSA